MIDRIYRNRRFFIVCSALFLATFFLIVGKLDGGQWTAVAGISVGAFNLSYLKQGAK